MATAIPTDLVDRAISGDASAIGDLLSAAQMDLRRYARRACRNSSDAEDAVQEALIILYRRIGSLRQAAAISGWLLTTVSRLCLRLGRAVTFTRADPEEAALDRRLAALPMDDLRIDLARAIESLPPHYRQIVVLRDLHERTIDEIAAALDTTRETVKARLHRARAILREYLAR